MDEQKKRPWGRAGWWNAAGLGLLAAGLPIVLVNHPTLGWGLISAAAAAFVIGAVVLRQPKTHYAPPRVTPILSVPVSVALTLDKEINMQEAFELIAQRLGVPMHGHDTKSTDARLNIFL